MNRVDQPESRADRSRRASAHALVISPRASSSARNVPASSPQSTGGVTRAPSSSATTFAVVASVTSPRAIPQDHVVVPQAPERARRRTPPDSSSCETGRRLADRPARQRRATRSGVWLVNERGASTRTPPSRADQQPDPLRPESGPRPRRPSAAQHGIVVEREIEVLGRLAQSIEMPVEQEEAFLRRPSQRFEQLEPNGRPGRAPTL